MPLYRDIAYYSIPDNPAWAGLDRLGWPGLAGMAWFVAWPVANTERRNRSVKLYV